MRHSPNALYCGDNLDVLRNCIPDESIDLVYLDPPFKSDQNYNLLFREKDGSKSVSQILAFEDTWEWNMEAERNYTAAAERGGRLGQIMVQFRTMLGDTDMLAYLAMMAPRLVELHRVLKHTGSLYLHCDSTASHYLKILLDGVFGPSHFKNEIIWKRNSAHSDARQGAKHYGRLTDTIFFYSKGDNVTWNQKYRPYDEEYVNRDYRRVDESGRRYRLDNIQGPGGAAKGNPFYQVMGVSRHWRYSREKMQQLIKEGRIIQTRPGAVPQYKRYLDEMPGVAIQNLWDDISVINNRSQEMLGYPTQKPLALLERIINVSSNEGDVVLDPFCGCGTAIEAAINLKRTWIGIDITLQAMRVTRNERFPKLNNQVTYDVIYRPCDITAAEAYAAEQPFEFQDWAVEKLDGVPSRPRSGDRGIDGRLYFNDGQNTPLRQILISVKGGKLKSPFVRELQGAVAREHAPMGVLISLHEPSKQMIRDAASSGFFACSLGTFPKIQIVTIRRILGEAKLELPPIQKMEYSRRPSLAVAAATQIALPGIA